MQYDKVRINELKQKYPKGTRIRVDHVEDNFLTCAVIEGTVRFVDDIGTIHCVLDDGRQIGIISEVDSFYIIERTSQSFML